jgi:hypothetical protein
VLVCHSERLCQSALRLVGPSKLQQRVTPAHVRHERELQLGHRRGDCEGAVVEVERLFRPTELDVSVTEQRQPPDERRRVAGCLRHLQRLPERDHAGVDITTVDRFALVEHSGSAWTMRMLQVPELKRGMGLGQDFILPCGTRRERIHLLGNGVCPPVMETVIRTLTAD